MPKIKENKKTGMPDLKYFDEELTSSERGFWQESVIDTTQLELISQNQHKFKNFA